jgi:phospholipid transport system substrate-binding protein
LEKRHAEVMSIIDQEGGAGHTDSARAAKLKSAIGQLLDFEELSRRSLSDHWDGLEEHKRQEFVALLTQLVERSYQKNLESIRNYQVQYDEAKPLGDSVLVHTVARSRKNRRAPAVEIDYTLFPREGSYRVYDIATDGVSLVSNYKRQFNKIIRRDGWDALIERMKKRLAEDGDSF